jgi:hypothetical protein
MAGHYTIPTKKEWLLGADRFGRQVTLTREGADYSIRITPGDQRDDGERINSLSRDLLMRAGEIAGGERG